MSTTSAPVAPGFAAHLARARASSRPLLDLTEADPSRCGLTSDPEEIEALLRGSGAAVQDAAQRSAAARVAVSSYLAGRGASVAPERVWLTATRDDCFRLLLRALCGPDDEVLIASPGRPSLEAVAAAESVRVGRYPLAYDGEWRLDVRRVRKTVSRRTRAIVVGNPADPTGAVLSPDDLELLDALCADAGLALVGDEAFVDTALAPCPGVNEATRCLAFHVSGLSGVCGLRRLEAEWVAASGPDALLARILPRLAAAAPALRPVAAPISSAVAALLARRPSFLSAVRARVAENRGTVAAAALREAPWTLQRGRGGCWAVLELGAAEEEESLCLELLDDGVAVEPGFLHGLPPSGYVVVSLLPEPEIFREALLRLDRRLRAPLVG